MARKIKENRKLEKRNLRAVEWTLYGLLIVYCITLFIPLLWMLVNSLKSYSDYLLHSFQLPEEWVFENYAEVFKVFKVDYVAKSGNIVRYGFPDMALYSVLYTFGFSAFHVFVTMQCAYVISKYKFRGGRFLYSLGIVVMIVPIIGSMPSAMVVRKGMGLYNNMFLHILTSQTTAFSGMHFLLLYAAFKRVPNAYREAVFIDGGGHFTAFFKIVLPQVFPSCVAVFVLQFLATWSDYNVFIIWLPSYPSLSVGMYLFQENAAKQGIPMPVILAVFVVVIIPTTALYIATQNILMSKFSVGGLKG